MKKVARPERREGVARAFVTTKQDAERRLDRLALPWTILRFGRLTVLAGLRGRFVCLDVDLAIILTFRPS